MDFPTNSEPHNMKKTDSQLVTNSPHALDPILELSIRVGMERLRQVRHSFNLALVMTGISTIISFVGVVLLLTGKASEGTVTTAGGMVSSMCCLQLAKETNEQLSHLLKELKDENH